MSDEKEPKKQGQLYWLGIAVLGVLLITLCMVPIFMMGLSVKETLRLLHHAPVITASPSPQEKILRAPDLTAIRVITEKAASNILPEPSPAPLSSSLLQLQIRVPEASLPQAHSSILTTLSTHHQQYLETDEAGTIHLILTLREIDWVTISSALTQSAEKQGFTISAPPAGGGEGAATNAVVAGIEILKK